MTLQYKRHYKAYRCTKLYSTSSFETALMELLAVSDLWNTKIILDNWEHVVDRLAEMNDLHEKREQREREERCSETSET